MRAGRPTTRVFLAVIGLAVVAVVAFWMSRGTPVQDPERHVLDLFRGPETTKANAWRIIKTLPSLDWSKLTKLDSARAFTLLEWLSTPGVADTKKATPYVMRGYRNLDGAFSEQYSNIVGRLYELQGAGFIRALGQLDPEGRDTVARYLAYYAYVGDLSGIETAVKTLLDSPDLPGSDREAALAILGAFEALDEALGN